MNRRGFLGLSFGTLVGIFLPKSKAAEIFEDYEDTEEFPSYVRHLPLSPLEVYYSKKFLETLKVNTASPFLCSIRRPIPFHSGKEIQFFTYQLKEEV